MPKTVKDIIIDKDSLNPEDLENTKLVTLDDGTIEEVYISRAGNIVTDPKLRNSTGGEASQNRRDKCWEEYVKTWRAGVPSARKAANLAGYSPNTAMNMSKMKWFKDKKDKLRRSSMMTNAERNLSRVLRMDYSKMKLMEDGTEEEEVDIDKLRVVVDVSKTVVTTLGKDVGYSTKVIEDKNVSHDIKIESVSYADPIPIEAQPIIKEAITEEITNE